ncbi:MAG: S8 family serine peptidase [Waterburya sp.]
MNFGDIYEMFTNFETEINSFNGVNCNVLDINNSTNNTISDDPYQLTTFVDSNSQSIDYWEGTLGADIFTLAAGYDLTVISGNGNIEFGSGYYDLLDLSNLSAEEVIDYSFADASGGGVIFDSGNGSTIFDYLALNDGSEILFEGIDGIIFSDSTVDLTVVPDDPLFGSQWNLHMMGVHNAWRFTTGSDDVLIGVQDSGLGVDANGYIHPELNDNTLYYADNIADEFFREVPGDSYQRNSSHGTCVQGIIAAASNNGLGISGINWNSDVLSIDIDIDNNYGDLTVFDATQSMIDYANSQAQYLVVNMSFGGGSIDPYFEQLVANNQNDTLFVIATGNESNNVINNPASLARAYDNVIAVGACLQDGTRASYSNYGEGITLMCPAVVLTTAATPNLQSGYVDFDYDYSFEGTSAATPNLAGVASLVWSVNPNLSAAQVKEILSETAYDLGVEGYDYEYGYGFVDADAAVRQALAWNWLSANSTTNGDLSDRKYSAEIADGNILIDNFSLNALGDRNQIKSLGRADSTREILANIDYSSNNDLDDLDDNRGVTNEVWKLSQSDDSVDYDIDIKDLSWFSAHEVIVLPFENLLDSELVDDLAG